MTATATAGCAGRGAAFLLEDPSLVCEHGQAKTEHETEQCINLEKGILTVHHAVFLRQPG